MMIVASARDSAATITAGGWRCLIAAALLLLGGCGHGEIETWPPGSEPIRGIFPKVAEGDWGRYVALDRYMWVHNYSTEPIRLARVMHFDAQGMRILFPASKHFPWDSMLPMDIELRHGEETAFLIPRSSALGLVHFKRISDWGVAAPGVEEVRIQLPKGRKVFGAIH